jgi:tripartite-type tricarboxylate transporter receptor subunit TctC
VQFRYGPLLILVSPAFGQPAQAQDYPTRPVTLGVPYPAGGGLDALAGQARCVPRSCVWEKVVEQADPTATPS